MQLFKDIKNFDVNTLGELDKETKIELLRIAKDFSSCILATTDFRYGSVYNIPQGDNTNIFEQMKTFDLATIYELDWKTRYLLTRIANNFVSRLRYYFKGNFIGNLRLGRVECKSKVISEIIKNNENIINDRLAKLGTRPKEPYIYTEEEFENVFNGVIGFRYVVSGEIKENSLILNIQDSFTIKECGEFYDVIVEIEFDKKKELK